MAYKHNIVPGHEALLDEIRRMCARWPNNELPTLTGTGNGTIYLRPNLKTSPQETWTITCTDNTTPGSEVWSVVGSVSGTLASATTNVPYSNAVIDIDIEDGSTAFIVGDYFTVVIGAPLLGAAEEWIEHRYDLGVETADENKLILEGPGLTGTEEIFVGLKSYFNSPEDWYNLGINGFSGYSAGVDYELQPGVSLLGEVPLYNQQLEYWLTVNAQRIGLGVKVETYNNSFYLGKILPYGSPGEFPYPLACIAHLSGQLGTRYSESYEMGFQGSPAHCYLRSPDGVWGNMLTYPYNDPWANGVVASLRDTPPNDYPLLPITIFETTPNIWGILDGFFYVPGFNNVAEDTITIGGDTYLVLHDVNQTGFNNYFAMRLD